MKSVRILEGSKHNKREHNPPTQTHMHIKRTCIFNSISTTVVSLPTILTPDDLIS
jgi:hypothetical protein